MVVYQISIKKTRKKERLALIAALGALAFISAVLIAWPALAYLGAKMFNQESVGL